MGECERPCLAYGPALAAAVPITEASRSRWLCTLHSAIPVSHGLTNDMIAAKLIVSSPGVSGVRCDSWTFSRVLSTRLMSHSLWLEVSLYIRRWSMIRIKWVKRNSLLNSIKLGWRWNPSNQLGGYPSTLGILG